MIYLQIALAAYFAIALLFTVSCHMQWPLLATRQDWHAFQVKVMLDQIAKRQSDREVFWTLFVTYIAVGLSWPVILYKHLRDL